MCIACIAIGCQAPTHNKDYSLCVDHWVELVSTGQVATLVQCCKFCNDPPHARNMCQRHYRAHRRAQGKIDR